MKGIRKNPIFPSLAQNPYIHIFVEENHIMNRREFMKTSTGLGAMLLMPGLAHGALRSSLPSNIISMSALQLSDAIAAIIGAVITLS